MFASELNISHEQEIADRKMLLQYANLGNYFLNSQRNANMVQNFKAEALVALQNTHRNKDDEGGLANPLNSLKPIIPPT